MRRRDRAGGRAAGAGAGAADAPRGPEPAEAAGEAAAALGEAGTFRFTAMFVRTRADAPGEAEQYASADGAVDLDGDRGRMEFRFDVPELAEVEPLFAEGMELAWDSERLSARIGDSATRTTRAEARESGGLLGRLPDEPAGLVSLLEHVERAEAIGTATVGGEETSGYRFDVDEGAAARAGVPAEVAPALEAGADEMDLTVEAWLGLDSLPRRLTYVLQLEPVRAEDGHEVLPARTVRVTYDLSGFGEDVAVDLPAAP